MVTRQRLWRAMKDPAFLEEFLEKPEKIAKEYGISLDGEELDAVQNIRRFLASGDVFCGEGQWLEGTLKVIRRVVSEFGSDALVEPQVRTEDLPEQIQPLARSLRQLVHNMTRELSRELIHAPFGSFQRCTAAVPREQTGPGIGQSPGAVIRKVSGVSSDVTR